MILASLLGLRPAAASPTGPSAGSRRTTARTSRAGRGRHDLVLNGQAGYVNTLDLALGVEGGRSRRRTRRSESRHRDRDAGHRRAVRLLAGRRLRRDPRPGGVRGQRPRHRQVRVSGGRHADRRRAQQRGELADRRGCCPRRRATTTRPASARVRTGSSSPTSGSSRTTTGSGCASSTRPRTPSAARVRRGRDPIDNNSLDYPHHSQDGSGRLHVVWRTLHDDGRLRYTRSDDGGATFSPAANLAMKETFIDPIVEAAPSGAGFAAWKGIGSSAIRVVPIDPQPEPAGARRRRRPGHHRADRGRPQHRRLDALPRRGHRASASTRARPAWPC